MYWSGGHSRSSRLTELQRHTALNLCKVIESFSQRNEVTLIPGLLSTLSADTIYEISTIGVHWAHCLHGHRKNLILRAKSWYFSNFLVAAISAAPPAEIEVKLRHELAIVSMTVTSHTAHYSVLQGTDVIPSGSFLSDLDKPTGSFNDGTPTRESACQIATFKLRWQLVLTKLRLQERPRRAPQGQICGSQVFAPKRKMLLLCCLLRFYILSAHSMHGISVGRAHLPYHYARCVALYTKIFYPF